MQTLQYILIYLDSIENILVLFVIFLYSLGENRFVYSNKLLPLKSVNPIQKCPHIIESYAFILQMFPVIFLFPKNFPISFGILSTQKLSKYITFLAFAYKAIQWVVPTDS